MTDIDTKLASIDWQIDQCKWSLRHVSHYRADGYLDRMNALFVERHLLLTGGAA